MGAPLSIRFDPAILDRLRRRARALPGATPSGLVQRLVDEGLRMAEHPGVTFKDGPTGRRAALVVGPDIWEVIKAVREVEERHDDAVEAAAALLHLPGERVRAAVRYFAAHPDEIEAELTMADEDSQAAEEEWRTQQRLLA